MPSFLFYFNEFNIVLGFREVSWNGPLEDTVKRLPLFSYVT